VLIKVQIAVEIAVVIGIVRVYHFCIIFVIGPYNSFFSFYVGGLQQIHASGACY